METAHTELARFQEILERKEAEQVQLLRRRDGIAIEASPDQMDEIQFASQRDLAIRNADRESNQMRQVRGALLRIRDGTFGICMDCDSAISSKRLAAVLWAARCIKCQEIADRKQQEGAEPGSDDFVDAA